MKRLLTSLALVLAAAACGGSDTAPSATIAITAPTTGAQQPLGTDEHKSVGVTFTTTNFTFEPCASMTSGNCGHVHVLIDGADCNSGGLPYNNPATSSPAQAFFAACTHQTGAHTVTLELHHADHTSIKGASGSTISSAVSFTTM